ncbi:hypothetical protein LINPERPRIM_LOCUS22392 [Linum perenne]
MRESVGLLAI